MELLVARNLQSFDSSLTKAIAAGAAISAHIHNDSLPKNLSHSKQIPKNKLTEMKALSPKVNFMSGILYIDFYLNHIREP